MCACWGGAGGGEGKRNTDGDGLLELKTQIWVESRLETATCELKTQMQADTVPMSCEDMGVGGDTDRDSSREL